MTDAAKYAIRELKELGVMRVVMLTGDDEATARAVGKDAGVDDVRAGLLPEERAEALVAEFGTVAMGAAGVVAAIETADVALMSDDLGRLPWLIRREISMTRQNLTSSLGVRLVFTILTFFGYRSV